MMQCTHLNRNGFALSIVLWIVAAMLIGVTFITSLSKDNLSLTKGLDDKLQARLEAESLLEVLKYIIVTSDYDNRSIIIKKGLPFEFPSKMILDGRIYKIENNDVNISLKDISSMLNVFYPNAQMIASLSTDNNQKGLFFTIKDSIDDWKDSDNIIRLNGAEESFYRLNKDVNYKPRNSPALQSIYELRLINGLDKISKTKWNNLKKHIYYGDGVQINLSLVDALYLSKLLKLNFLEANALMHYRETDFDKFKKIVSENKNYNDEYMGFGLSFKIKIDIIVKNNKSVSKLNTLISFMGSEENFIVTNRFEIW